MFLHGYLTSMENPLQEEQLVQTDLSKSEMVVFGKENVSEVFPKLTISIC